MTEAILQIRALERSFGTCRALRGLDFDVQPGELFGLVGPDGAGKTTAIRILAGLMAADRGEVRVAGFDPLGSHREVRALLGYMPQHYSLYGDLSVDENLAFFARMFDLEHRDFLERRERLLRISRLERFADRRADALSGGMYKKLALSCALLHRPKVLLLDEPTNGVDPVSRRELWELLYEFVAEGMTVVLSTPYMDEAARCHRVGLIHQGRLLVGGSPGELLSAFRGTCLRVEGAERPAVERALLGNPDVWAMSPAGSRIRLVLRPGAEDDIGTALAPLGARLAPTRPEFEDLFLVETGKHAEVSAGGR